MTLEEPILIFIPRISSSKEPSPPRWLCLALIQLKGKTKESREWGVAQCGVSLERGYPSIYTVLEMVLEVILGASLAPTTLACFHATTTARGGWAAPAGGRPSLDHGHSPLPSCGRPWARPGWLPVVLCPICIDLIGVSLVPLCKSASESAF